MFSLRFVTSPIWLELALGSLDQILIEQAHLEKKAASAAVNFLFRYPDWIAIQVPLADLAREELEHFVRVQTLLVARGLQFGRLRPAPYAERLLAACRGTEPDRMLDSMLCCAVIEARSCERMKLLSEALSRGQDRELCELYSDLVRSEARHHALYLELCDERFPRAVVRSRLEELLEHEASVLAAYHPLGRLHG